MANIDELLWGDDLVVYAYEVGHEVVFEDAPPAPPAPPAPATNPAWEATAHAQECQCVEKHRCTGCKEEKAADFFALLRRKGSTPRYMSDEGTRTNAPAFCAQCEWSQSHIVRCYNGHVHELDRLPADGDLCGPTPTGKSCGLRFCVRHGQYHFSDQGSRRNASELCVRNRSHGQVTDCDSIGSKKRGRDFESSGLASNGNESGRPRKRRRVDTGPPSCGYLERLSVEFRKALSVEEEIKCLAIVERTMAELGCQTLADLGKELMKYHMGAVLADSGRAVKLVDLNVCRRRVYTAWQEALKQAGPFSLGDSHPPLEFTGAFYASCVRALNVFETLDIANYYGRALHRNLFAVASATHGSGSADSWQADRQAYLTSRNRPAAYVVLEAAASGWLHSAARVDIGAERGRLWELELELLEARRRLLAENPSLGVWDEKEAEVFTLVSERQAVFAARPAELKKRLVGVFTDYAAHQVETF